MATVYTGSSSYPPVITIETSDVQDYILVRVPSGLGAHASTLTIRVARIPLPNNRFAMGVVFTDNNAYMIEERKGDPAGACPAIIVLHDDNDPKSIELDHWKLKKWTDWR